MPVLWEFLTDKILDYLFELDLKDVSVCSLAACNITVKCWARMWWTICVMHGSILRKVSFVYILKCIQNVVKYKMQTVSIEKYTGLSTVDWNMVSCKMFYDIIFILLIENILGTWICIYW